MRAAIFTAILSVLPLAALAAPYVGMDGNRYSFTMNSADPELYPQSASGWNLHVGERFGAVAGELGYGSSTTQGSGDLDNLHLTRISADGLFYVPIFHGVNLVATAGGAEINYGISNYVRDNVTDADGKNHSYNNDVTLLHGDEIDWRAGGGLSFGWDQFELRLLARYQPLSMQHAASNAMGLDFGFNYYF